MTIYSKSSVPSFITTSDLTPTFGQKLEATVTEAVETLPSKVISGYLEATKNPLFALEERNKALSFEIEPKKSFAETSGKVYNKLNQQQVNDAISQAGLTEKQFHLKGDTYTAEGVQALIDRKKKLILSEDVASRTDFDAGSVVRGAVSLGVGLSDPTNLMLAYFPAGRLATMMKFGWVENQLTELALKSGVVGTVGAAETLLGRTAARSALGAVEGGTGATLLEPFYSQSRIGLGDDYNFTASLANIAGGAILGGTIHSAVGGLGDAFVALKKSHDELNNNLSPQTRDDIQQTAVAQMAQGKVPDIEAIINTDPAINTASVQDVKDSMFKANAVENEYIVKDVPPIVENKEFIPVEPTQPKKTDYIAEQERLTKLADYELTQFENELKEWGLYSRKEVTPLTTETPTISHETNLDYHVEQITNDIRKTFGKSADKLLKDNRLNIVRNASELPGFNHPEDVIAYNKDGRSYIIADRITPQQATSLVLHEVGAHTSLPKMLGKEGYNDILNQAERLINEGDLTATIARDMIPIDTPKGQIRDELLGYMMEYAPEHSLVQKLIAKVKAWIYKTFPSLRDKIKLSYADMVSLVKTSIKDYANNPQYEAMRSEGLYSRSSLINKDQIESMRAEINMFDELKAKVNSYGEALKSVTIGDEANAITQIKEKTGLSLGESERLYKEMVRKTNAMESQQLRGEEYDWSLDPQERAIEEMVNTQLNDLTRKKRAKIHDQRKRVEQLKHIVEQYGNPTDEHPINQQWGEGADSITIGSQLVREGANINISSMQKVFDALITNELYTPMEREGLINPWLNDKGMQKDSQQAVLLIAEGKDISHLSPEAQRIGQLITNAYDKGFQLRNERGTWITKNNQYAMDNSYMYDQISMVKVSREDFRKTALERWDIPWMADKQGLSPKQILNEIDVIYDDILSGHSLKYTDNVETEGLSFMFGAPNISTKTGKSRTIRFKDAAAQIAEFDQYSKISYPEAVLKTLDRAAKQAGILDRLGPDYERNLDWILKNVQDHISDPKEKYKFNQSIKRAHEYLEYVDGRAFIPVNSTISRISANIRSILKMGSLGGTPLYIASDFITHASAIKKSGGDGYLTSIPKDLVEFLTPYKGTERLEVIRELRLINDNMRARMYDYNGTNNLGNRLKGMEAAFYKFTGANKLTQIRSTTSSDSFARNLAQWSKTTDYKKLPIELQQELTRANILENEWNNIYRKAELIAPDGRDYLVPQSLEKSLPTIKEQIKKENPEISDKELDVIANRKLSDMKNTLHLYFINKIHDEVIGTPNVRNIHFLKRGTKSGTLPGEVWNSFTMLKLWPTWFTQNVIGREIYGRGYDTLGQYIKNGKGDMVHLVNLLLWSTMSGAVSQSLKAIANGKKAPDYSTAKAWGEAFTYGGGIGYYTDFLFTENRAGHSPLSFMGPAFSKVEDIYKIYNIAKDPNSSEKAINNIPGQAFNVIKSLIPFNNVWWTKKALDYLLIYNIQEQLNPGYLSRMQRNAEELNQPYFIPPTQALGQ